MSDEYFNAVLIDVWLHGGDINAVSRTRVEACEANGAPADEIATHELKLQHARAQLARDIARLTTGSR